MSEPKRWLDGDAGSTSLEAQLLRAGTKLNPPGELDARVWVGLAAKLPALSASALAGASTGAASNANAMGGAGAGTGSIGGAGAKVSATVAIASKAKVVAAVVALVGIGTVNGTVIKGRGPTAPVWTTHADERQGLPVPPSVPQDRTSTIEAIVPKTTEGGASRTQTDLILEARAASKRPTSTAAAESLRHVQPLASTTPLAREESSRANVDTSGVSKSQTDAPSPVESTLRLETRLLREAHEFLGRGDIASAEQNLTRVDALRDKKLTEERDALGVRCAIAKGDEALAISRGEAFLSAYPGSRLAPSIEKIVRHSKDRVMETSE